MKDRQDIGIRGINEKSLEAWEELYKNYYPALCSYSENLVKRSDVTQDIVQELLVNLWRSDRLFNTQEELTYFLYKATYNNSLNYLRTCKIQTGILSTIRENTLSEDAPFSDKHFAETIREELLRQLHLHIQKLPPERRRIILLSLEGRKREEIAQILGISPNTVKAQKTCALKTLRDALKNSAIYSLLLIFC
ncbi:MAG: RNA polymerase sigma-70 factor [Culturomica sp.]|jgi:RNA polymerase sigma-70 factor (ECF subfamily)|nr:RNA polymerase sigma-70 factor [Culturomica sp.]